MNVELVAVGTELLLGFTVDTNGAEIARALAAHGVRVLRRTAVGDRDEDIRAAVGDALARTGAVITTGGLGPTRDDLTKTAVAGLFGTELRFDEGIWAGLLERFRRLGRPPAASNRSQAEVPVGAEVLPNRWGTAPGLWLEGAPGLVIMLPGVPQEMRRLLEYEVVPRLAERASGTVIRSRMVRTTAIAESALAERMGEVERDIVPLSLAYLPGVEGVDLRASAWSLDPADADRRLAEAVRLLRERAGEHAYGEDETDLAHLVLERARIAGRMLGTAESCTGGLVGARLTAIPGSSEAYRGGVVCYSNRLKVDLLGVPAPLLEEHGAVSEAVALAMAEGARGRLDCDLAVAVTGIAGPGGGSAEKPVGTVWIAMADAAGSAARHIVFAGSRQEIRERAAQTALFLLQRRLAAG
ncbi:MAG TPA: competence/damage-inducible protein A [Gemmatimonadales bacterium]|nr:competence/damage-inducible protein A [Gemmatimonadales bacterium]